MTRQPVVAGRFYPGRKADLIATLKNHLPEESHRQHALGVISPHAGYLYSGDVAGETLAQVQIPETVIILGPNHSGRGRPVALSTTTWNMTLGDVAIDQPLAEELLQQSSIIEADETAHSSEHSLEVQIPFLQLLRKNVRIVPLCISHLSYGLCGTVANAITKAIRKTGRGVLLLASSDMTHYEPRRIARTKDHQALEHLLNLDPEGFYTTVHDQRMSICGVIPITIMLLSCLQQKASRATLVRYTDSGEVSGDIDQVVGYAGLIIS